MQYVLHEKALQEDVWLLWWVGQSADCEYILYHAKKTFAGDQGQFYPKGDDSIELYREFLTL